MKILKLVFGCLCGLAFAASLIRLLLMLPLLSGGTYNVSYFFGSVAGTLLWGALCFALIKSALNEDGTNLRR